MAVRGYIQIVVGFAVESIETAVEEVVASVRVATDGIALVTERCYNLNRNLVVAQSNSYDSDGELVNTDIVHQLYVYLLVVLVVNLVKVCWFLQ